MPPLPPDADFRPLPGKLARTLLHLAGHAALVAGLVGLLVPVMPTTPFLIVAAACYARSSERFYRWLLNHRFLGPPVQEWYRHRSLTRRQKAVIVAFVTTTLAISTGVIVTDPWARLGAAMAWLTFLVVMWRIPTRRPAPP